MDFLHLTYNIKTTNIYTRLQVTWELLVSIPLNQGLPSCIKMFRSLESLHIYLIQHLNTKTITIRDINFTQFYFLYVWQAKELTYVIHEVVSFLTKSGVGWDTICSKGGGFQTAGSVPTGNVTDLTNRIGWTPKCKFPLVIGVSDFLGKLGSRRAVSVLGLILFLGGFSSEDKTRDLGHAALFLNAVDFFSLSVSCGVRLNPVSKLSKFVCSDVNTDEGENSHLSPLRNAWGECIGVAGGVFSLSSKGFFCIPGDEIIGRKGSLSFRNTVLLFSMSSSISSCILSMLYTFH